MLIPAARLHFGFSFHCFCCIQITWFRADPLASLPLQIFVTVNFAMSRNLSPAMNSPRSAILGGDAKRYPCRTAADQPGGTDEEDHESSESSELSLPRRRKRARRVGGTGDREDRALATDGVETARELGMLKKRIRDLEDEMSILKNMGFRAFLRADSKRRSRP